MKKESYVNIQGWMVTDLHLTGVKLMLYAIIYGFSQDERSDFHGSISYLQEWTGSCENTVRKYLSELTKEGLISAFAVNGNTTHFRAISEPPQNLNPSPSKIEGNNKDNKKREVSKDTKIRPNLFQQCVEIIDSIITDNDVREKLLAYLSIRIKEPLSAKAWQTIINKLYEIADNKEMALSVIQQSIDKCYKSFYPIQKSPYQKKDSVGARDTSTLKEDEITQAYHLWAESGRFFGSKEEFKELVEKGEIDVRHNYCDC